MSVPRSLEQSVKEELKKEPGLEESQIRVTEDDGVVTLQGYVDGYASSELAGHAVFRVAGVRALINQLAIRRGVES
jgi:osmotically-inducible protein OsmY